MRIYLGGHLNFYHPQKDKWLEIKLQTPTRLADILESSNIPCGEVYLAAVNGEQVDLLSAVVEEQDEVRLFPPVGGGAVLVSRVNQSRRDGRVMSNLSLEDTLLYGNYD